MKNGRKSSPKKRSLVHRTLLIMIAVSVSARLSPLAKQEWAEVVVYRTCIRFFLFLSFFIDNPALSTST